MNHIRGSHPMLAPSPDDVDLALGSTPMAAIVGSAVPDTIRETPLSTIVEWLGGQTCPARVRAEERFTFADFLDNPTDLKNDLVRRPGYGIGKLHVLVSTIGPFARACRAVAAASLSYVLGPFDKHAAADRVDRSQQHECQLLPWQFPALTASALEYLGRVFAVMYGAHGQVSGDDLLRVISKLPDALKTNILDAHGLGGSGTTRGQISPDALGRLRCPAMAHFFWNYLEARKEPIWAVLSQGDAVLRPGRLVAQSKMFSPITRLALTVGGFGFPRPGSWWATVAAFDGLLWVRKEPPASCNFDAFSADILCDDQRAIAVGRSGVKVVQRATAPTGINNSSLLSTWRAFAPSDVPAVVWDGLAGLRARRLKVLELCHGLDGAPPKSMGEVAGELNVSSARVQQIKREAFMALAALIGVEPLRDYLVTKTDEIFDALSGGAPVLSDDHLTEARTRLSPFYFLAFDMLQGAAPGPNHTLRAWLRSCAVLTKAGWVRRDRFERWEKQTSVLADALLGLTSPVPVATAVAVSGLPENEVLAVTPLLHGWSVVHGCLINKTRHYGTALPTITAGIYETARHIAGGRPFDVATLIQAHRQRHPEEPVTPFDLRQRMEFAHHLFTPVLDNIWVALPADERVGPALPIPFEPGIVDAGEITSPAKAAWAAPLLRNIGPMTNKEITHRHLQEVGTELMPLEVSYIIAKHPAFYRPAPGVISFYMGRDRLFPAGKSLPILLTAHQCRLYTEARLSGAPVDYYPAWGYRYEMDLAEWARAEAQKDQSHAPTVDLYHRLLAAIEPWRWPAEDDVRAVWEKRQRSSAMRGLYDETPPDAGRRFPDPDHFFSALAHLAHFGWTSWFAVNRSTRVTLLSRDAVDVLTMLVAGDLARPPRRWQCRHNATVRTRELYRELSDERHRNGFLRWDMGGLAALVATMRGFRGKQGWLTAAAVKQTLAGFDTGSAREGAPFAQIQDSLDANERQCAPSLVARFEQCAA